MTAYSFQPRFVEPIRSGTKRQTIRAPRRVRDFTRSLQGGHAPVGGELQLYCRQRHPGGFLIQRTRCASVEPITLCFEPHSKFVVVGGEPAIVGPSLLDQFARRDGFADLDEMIAFWREKHGTDWFQGWLIRWGNPE